MTDSQDPIKQITGLSIGEWIFVWTVWSIIEFFIAVWIIRWIFKVNKAVGLLEEISKKIDDLPKKPVEWDDIMPPKPKPTDAELYGPKF